MSENIERSEAVRAFKNLLRDFAKEIGFVPDYEQFARYLVEKSGVDYEFVEHITKEAGGYDSVLSQVFGSHGGTDRLTNIRSPGMGPAKIPASGNSPNTATNVASPNDLNEERYQAYDSRGTYSQANPDLTAPQGRRVSPNTYTGRTEWHPRYGQSKVDTSGEGYNPSSLRSGLEKWAAEKQAGAMSHISPGTQPFVVEREDKEPTAEELASEISNEQGRGVLGQTPAETAEQIKRREAQKPRLVRRDQKGVGAKDVRTHYHESFTGES